MEIGIVRPRSITEEMRTAYLDYAMSVIVSRALPDARDGLKPVQTRIMFGMWELGIRSGQPHKKSARIVGDILGKMHPHGDSSVYDALVRLAQPWNMRYPLIDGQGNFGCFTGETKLKLMDGTERSFAELAQLPEDEIFYVYSVDSTGSIVAGEGRSSRITRRAAEIIELTFDDGSTVRCTPDHRFMLRDGSWKQAQQLTIEDSLMAGYFDDAPVRGSKNKYLRVLQPNTGSYEFVHRISDRYNAQRAAIRSNGRSFVRHHRNFNRLDNRPTNIERLSWIEHAHLHAAHLHKLWQEPAFRERQRRGVIAYIAAHPEIRELRRARMIAQNRDSAFRQANGQRIACALRLRHQHNPSIMRQQGERIRQLWQDPDYRAKMSRALSGLRKQPLTQEQKDRIAAIISEKSTAMWADNGNRERITAAIIASMGDPAIRAQLSARSKGLWRTAEFRAKFAREHHSAMAHKYWSKATSRPFHRAKIAQQWQDDKFVQARRRGVRASNARRLSAQPLMMRNLAASAAAVLSERWRERDYQQRVMRSKIAGYVSRLIAESGVSSITPDLYDARRSARWIPSSAKALTYFESFDELRQVAATHNHRVVATRWLDERVDVYDITVNEHHNFMLANGCVVHNSVDGDPPAAMRYTEIRLTPIAEEMLLDIEKNTVDFRDNFDGTFREPTVLPAKLPNLLLNGAAGIAVGMATNIPPHNLNELCDGIILLIDNPEATVEDLLPIIPGPDFPTAGLILGARGIVDAYSTGRGQITMRAKAHVEEAARSAFNIIVTELPYQVNKARLQERIAELAKDKKIEGIRDVRDESDRTGMRLVIILKQDAQPRKVLNALYKHTQMQTTFGVNMLSLVENGRQPRLLTIKRMLQEHIDHRREVIRRRTAFDLDRARARAHILEGLKIALDNLDAIIQTIRDSRTRESARNNLMANFKFSEIQANAILEMQLGRLAALERKRIEDEYREMLKLIADLEEILNTPARVAKIIKDDLKYLKEKFGDPRRTRIIPDADGEVSDEDLIPDIKVLVTLTDRGYVKRVNADTYRTQRRGGKGIKGAPTREADVVRHIINCSTMDDLLFFTDRGKVYQLKTHEVPDASRTAKGLPLVNLISLEPGEQVTSILNVPDFNLANYLVMATVRGKIKRTLLKEYSQVRSNGLIAIGLEENDLLGWVAASKGDEDILMTTVRGQTIRFTQEQARAMGRPATGVIGINLDDDDAVVGMGLVRQHASLLVVTTSGMGKRTELDEYPAKGRGTGGVISIKLRQGDSVALAQVVDDSSTLTLISANGIIMRTTADEISKLGRNTQGVAVVNVVKKDRVAALCVEDAFEEETRSDRVMVTMQ